MTTTGFGVIVGPVTAQIAIDENDRPTRQRHDTGQIAGDGGFAIALHSRRHHESADALINIGIAQISPEFAECLLRSGTAVRHHLSICNGMRYRDDAENGPINDVGDIRRGADALIPCLTPERERIAEQNAAHEANAEIREDRGRAGRAG